ncbi:uncharacterized protein LOC126744724 [Anthonomus grandis grandis]|uniref:uncharacterized protein LOC126744724 n=1 Tax=Anthonomus grandis grandis TaxID=2921223 RepID=UPI002165D377|nr:uncharacterized protein LOC126744724 [Anthonomus grandis grandis]
MDYRCQLWKGILGFTGEHRYADLTPEQCYKRVNICSLHFAESSFMSPSNQRLRPDAIATLFLTRASTSTDNSNIIASHTLRKEFSDASVQTDTPMQVNVSVQTDVCNNTDKFCQTSMKIWAMTPRKIQLRKEIKNSEKGRLSRKKIPGSRSYFGRCSNIPR